jgi:hypothetical protein
MQGNQLVATCVKEVNFFTFANGVITGKKGLWGSAMNSAEAVLCQAFVDTSLFTGAFSGNIIIWSGNSIQKQVKAHTDGCHALATRTTGKGIISGGGDGMIIVWGLGGGGLV